MSARGVIQTTKVAMELGSPPVSGNYLHLTAKCLDHLVDQSDNLKLLDIYRGSPREGVLSFKSTCYRNNGLLKL